MDGLRDAIIALTGPVSIDLLEAEDEYLLIVDLPGATPENTSISTANGVLRIVAERDDEPAEATIVSGERPRTLEVELPLPDDVRDSAASASLADGVMEITLPRGLIGTSIPIEEA